MAGMISVSKHISFSLPILTAIFPGVPGLVGFIEVKDDGGGGDSWNCNC